MQAIRTVKAWNEPSQNVFKRHVPHELIPHPHRSENLKASKFYKIPLYFPPKNTKHIRAKPRELNLRFWNWMKQINSPCEGSANTQAYAKQTFRHGYDMYSAISVHGAGRGEGAGIPITTHHQTTDRPALSLLFQLTKLTEILDLIYSCATKSHSRFL